MKEDDKNHDGWKNSIKKKLFDKELRRDIQLWKKRKDV